MDLIALFQQQLGQVGTILPGNSGNQRLLTHPRYHETLLSVFS